MIYRILVMGSYSSLSVEYREKKEGSAWLSSVALFVDGEERFAEIGSGGYIGLHPSELADQQALTDPSTSPKGVFLYRCDCGELGCGAVMARVFRSRDQVVWDHFGSGNQPLPNHDDAVPHNDALFFAEGEYESVMNEVKELALRHRI